VPESAGVFNANSCREPRPDAGREIHRASRRGNCSELAVNDELVSRADNLSKKIMQLAVLNNKNVWAGAMLIAIGAAAVVVARNYSFGTALRMGPGYFPSLLGGLLVLFGLYLVATGLRNPEEIEGNWALRALIMLPLSLVLFGILMEYAGFIPALIVLIVGSAAAGSEFKLVESLLLAVGLTAFAVVLFIWGIGLPYPLLIGL